MIVRHHNAIETIGVWRTSNASVMKWITGGSKHRTGKKADLRPYVTTDATVLKTFVHMKPVRARGKVTPKLGKRKRQQGTPATEWHQAVCRIVDSYANGRYDKAVEEAAKCFNTPEDASLKKHRVGGSYWARKRNNPTVQFPVAIANTLRMWYNEQNPHCTPEEAASRLISKAEYQHSLYVKHVMTAGKTKAFFSGLKSKKVNGVVPVLSTVATASGYKEWTTLNDLKEECKRRLEEGSMAKPLRQPTTKAGWATLLELNDMQIENSMSLDAEEAAHGDEEDSDGDDCDDDDEGDDEGDEPVCLAEAECVYDALGDDTLPA